MITKIEYSRTKFFAMSDPCKHIFSNIGSACPIMERKDETRPHKQCRRLFASFGTVLVFLSFWFVEGRCSLEGVEGQFRGSELVVLKGRRGLQAKIAIVGVKKGTSCQNCDWKCPQAALRCPGSEKSFSIFGCG
jgi:hypothetical protein